MARQRGIIKLDGTLEDITFQKTRDGYRAKVKSEIPASRIASDPKFIRTRENMAEFSTVGKAGKVLRAAFESKIKQSSDRRVVSRLVQKLFAVLKTDTTNLRGQRTVADGTVALLEGFDFSLDAELGKSLTATFTTAIERTLGECTVEVPSFVPTEKVSMPQGATHFRIFAIAAEIDFENNTHTEALQVSEALPWDAKATTAISLVNTVSPSSTLPIFIALGIEYMQDLNGVKYPFFDSAFNAMKLIKVDLG